nr:beta-ketoacyl-[acyl-carrier-protein] synthase family protein [uncultured Anaerosporobacter sp.]
MRVVVTGLGSVSSLGKNTEEFWSRLIAGEIGIKSSIERKFIDAGLSEGGFINQIDSLSIEEKELDRTIQLGLVAAREAVKDSGLELKKESPFRVGVSVGTSIGGYVEMEEHLRCQKDGKSEDSNRMKQIPPAVIAGFISKQFGTRGPQSTTVTACAAGANSLTNALDFIREGHCDVVIAGGSDPLSFMSQTGFHSMKVLSKDYCRPFNKNKTGILIGESAAFLILESLEHAKKRNAKIYAEFKGYGLSNDAYHATSPNPNGEGAIRCINRALEDSKIDVSEIDYVNAHGTGTKMNDSSELNAIGTVFKEKGDKLPVITSIKGAVGHTLGTAGSIEALATVLAIYHKLIPPTALLKESMDEQYNFVPDTALKKDIRNALSNSFAFGGNTAALIFGRYEE